MLLPSSARHPRKAVLADQVIEHPIGIPAIRIGGWNLKVPAVRAKPKRAEIILFGDTVTTASFQLPARIPPG